MLLSKLLSRKLGPVLSPVHSASELLFDPLRQELAVPFCTLFSKAAL